MKRAWRKLLGKEGSPMQVRRRNTVPEGVLLPMLLMLSSFAVLFAVALLP
jgi:hypothetical protein